MMKKVLFMWFLSLAVCTAWAQGPNGSGTYYQKANGLKGKALKTAFAGIIVNPRNVGYDGLYEAYKKTDTRADGYVRDWYSNTTKYRHGVDNKGNYSKEGDMYNREHSVPQSWFSGSGIKSDIVHVLPTDGYVNNRRSNYPFGEVKNATYQSAGGYSKLGSCKTDGYTGTVFEPNDEVKGDIARIYFYMITRYESSCGSWGHDVFSANYPGLTTWTLNMMMRWSKQDPVDEREIARNNAVYEVQGNRNPFVDYPGLEEYTWGSKTSEQFSYDNYDGTGVGGGSDDNQGGNSDDNQGGNSDDNQGGSQQGTDPAKDTEIALNSLFFGTSYTTTIPKAESDDLVGTQDGVTAVYALGSGNQRYSSSVHIRLYPGNTLTFSANGGQITEVEFTSADAGSSNQLQADKGQVSGMKWTGSAAAVTFTTTGSSGHIKLPLAKVKVAATQGISPVVGPASAPSGYYTLGGQRMGGVPSRKGIYVTDKKKVVVR